MTRIPGHRECLPRAVLRVVWGEAGEKVRVDRKVRVRADDQLRTLPNRIWRRGPVPDPANEARELDDVSREIERHAETVVRLEGPARQALAMDRETLGRPLWIPACVVSRCREVDPRFLRPFGRGRGQACIAHREREGREEEERTHDDEHQGRLGDVRRDARPALRETPARCRSRGGPGCGSSLPPGPVARQNGSMRSCTRSPTAPLASARFVRILVGCLAACGGGAGGTARGPRANGAGDGGRPERHR